MSHALPTTYRLGFKHFPQLPVSERYQLQQVLLDGNQKEIPQGFLDILQETGRRYVMKKPDEVVYHFRLNEGRIKLSRDGDPELIGIFFQVVKEAPHSQTMQEMLEKQLTFSVRLDSQLMSEKSEQSEGQATGRIRFPHMLYRISERFDSASKPNICIAGPGIINDRGVYTSPILAEMHLLFPQSKITVIDKDKKSLTEMVNTMSKKGLAYDYTTLFLYQSGAQNGVLLNPKYKGFFMELFEKITTLSKQGVLRDRMECLSVEMIQVQHQLRPVVLDFGKTSPEKLKDTYQIIIATLSLVYAFQEKIDQKDPDPVFPIMARFLKVLDINGALYMDNSLISMLKSLYGDAVESFAFKYLEVLVGSKLEIKILPLSEFFPSIQGDSGCVNNLTFDLMQGGKGDELISSRSVMEITRRGVSDLSVEEKEICEKQAAEARTTLDDKLKAGHEWRFITGARA